MCKFVFAIVCARREIPNEHSRKHVFIKPPYNGFLVLILTIQLNNMLMKICSSFDLPKGEL